MVKRMPRRYACPVELTQTALGGKWKSSLLARLKLGPARYRDLRRFAPGLSDKVLTQRLRELEEAGFVAHDAEVYALSALGASLAPALDAMWRWGEAQAARYGAQFAIDDTPPHEPDGALKSRRAAAKVGTKTQP